MQQNQQVVKKNSGTLWTMVGIVIVLAVIVAIYFITQKSINKQPSLENDMVPGVDYAGQTVNIVPKSLTVTSLETFPYKVQAQVSFDLPNSCSTAASSVTQSGKVFTVNVTASQPKDAMCAQVITPAVLTVDIPVAGLAAGTYTVDYEDMTKTFTLAQNNQIEYSSDK